jgi:hypothetical protein
MLGRWVILSATIPLFAASLLMIELGYRYRLRWLIRADPGSNAGIGAVSTTGLSLMGLVLAFSFSNAAGRLDASRKSILDEMTAIESVWQRIDLAEPQARDRLRLLFREYVEARIRAYEALPDLTDYQRQSEIAAALLNKAWPIAIEGSSVTVNRPLLLTAVTSVSDAVAARNLSLLTHIPTGVLLFLFGIVLTGSLIVGTLLGDLGHRQWFYRLVIAAVLTSVVNVIIDMEYPRLGVFNLLKEPDTMFVVNLRNLMH